MRDLDQLGLKKLLSIHYPARGRKLLEQADCICRIGDFQSITPQGDGNA